MFHCIESDSLYMFPAFNCFQYYEERTFIFIRVLDLPMSLRCTRILDAHAQVVKRVAGLHDDGSIKPFSAVEGREADYVHRCCRLSANMWAS